MGERRLLQYRKDSKDHKPLSIRSLGERESTKGFERKRQRNTGGQESDFPRVARHRAAFQGKRSNSSLAAITLQLSSSLQQASISLRLVWQKNPYPYSSVVSPPAPTNSNGEPWGTHSSGAFTPIGYLLCRRFRNIAS